MHTLFDHLQHLYWKTFLYIMNIFWGIALLYNHNKGSRKDRKTRMTDGCLSSRACGHGTANSPYEITVGFFFKDADFIGVFEGVKGFFINVN